MDVLNAFLSQRILIVGDVMLDEYLFGTVRRISQEAPIPVVALQDRQYRPGGASNVAMNIAALGATPMLCSVVGDDAEATRLERLLTEQAPEMQVAFMRDTTRPTTLKTRVLAQGQQMLRLDVEDSSPIPVAAEDALLADACARLATVSACVLSDYAKGTLTERVCREIIRHCRQRGIPVIIDPKGHQYQRYAGATVITPNIHEAAAAAHRLLENAQELPLIADDLLAILHGTSLLITRGGEGMSLYREDAPPAHIPAVSRPVYDVTGAGDTVVAVLALALAAGLPMEQAMQVANTAAGEVVGKLGTSVVTREELRRLLLSETPSAVVG
jgi:D-beta-D-heptose 7-phosphate kinase/D-beta-D-heptose 1-phosphate adenosyltransferase